MSDWYIKSCFGKVFSIFATYLATTNLQPRGTVCLLPAPYCRSVFLWLIYSYMYLSPNLHSPPPSFYLRHTLLYSPLAGSLIQVPMSEKGKITRGRLGSLSLKKEGERQCFLFSKHLIICTRGSGGKLHLTKVRARTLLHQLELQLFPLVPLTRTELTLS